MRSKPPTCASFPESLGEVWVQLLEVEDGERVVEHVHFERLVVFGAGGERGVGVDFEEPGAEVGVEHDVVAEELEAVLVVGEQRLHGFEAVHEDLLDLREALLDALGAEPRGQEELEVPELPLAVVAVLVLLVALLDRDVRAVDVCRHAGVHLFSRSSAV